MRNGQERERERERDREFFETRRREINTTRKEIIVGVASGKLFAFRMDF